MAIDKSKQQIPRDESAPADNLQMVLRTEFGPLWMEGVLQGKNERTSTAVFVEGNSLQYWAKDTFGRELDCDDLRSLIAPCAREPFQIHYYLEITDTRGEKAAKRLGEDGLQVHIVDRRGPWPESHSEDHICANARDILPVVKHLILVCGGVDPTFVNLLGGAKNMGCETTLLSFSAPKKIWQVADHLVNIKTAWRHVQRSPPEGTMKPAKQLNLSDRPRVVILPVRPDEEQAILSRLTLAKDPYVGKHGSYKLGTIQRGGGTLLVAIKRIIEQGNIRAQTAARNAIEDLDPDWIVLVGIGGGIPANEFTLGDVLVATRVHDLTAGAYKERGRPQVEVTNQGGPMSQKTQDLIDQIPLLEHSHAGWNSGSNIKAKRPKVDLSDDLFYGSKKWQSDTRSSLEFHFGKERRKSPKFWPAPFAGDGFLVKDTRVVSRWREHARDLGLVEMELEGVYAAARLLNREYPIVCIRGVSDIVGFNRDHGWTAYACNSAGAFCVWLLAHMPDRYFGS